MKALVRYAKDAGSLKLMDVPVPEIKDDQVLIQVKAAGVCGSDVHIYKDRCDTSIPLIVGHEFSGCLVKVGQGVSGWHIGDRVVVENNPYACRACPTCRRGHPNICPDKRALGFRSDGCFTEYVAVPANVLHRVPDGLPYEVAALSEPFAVAVHATVNRGALKKGEDVVVFGPGTIGLMCAQAARAMDAGKVTLIGIERDKERMAFAESMGIRTVEFGTGGWDEITGMADLIVEASGSHVAASEALRLSGRASRLVIVGMSSQAPDIPWNSMLNREITVSFSYSSTADDWRLALELLSAGKSQAERMITAIHPLSEWQTAFEKTEKGMGTKTVLIP